MEHKIDQADILQDASKIDSLREKLQDLETPGFEVPLDPDEAITLGAFVEDAVSREDALESVIDTHHES